VPGPGAIEAWLLTALALVAVSIEYAAGSSPLAESWIPGQGTFLLGYIAVMWVYRSRKRSLPEPVL